MPLYFEIIEIQNAPLKILCNICQFFDCWNGPFEAHNFVTVLPPINFSIFALRIIGTHIRLGSLQGYLIGYV
jgi:hypothetical protein